VSFTKSCLYCKNLLVKETDEMVRMDFSKFKHPEFFNNKVCEYFCSLDDSICSDKDFYCHKFVASKEDKEDV
jgi:hypothetical protein